MSRFPSAPCLSLFAVSWPGRSRALPAYPRLLFLASLTSKSEVQGGVGLFWIGVFLGNGATGAFFWVLGQILQTLYQTHNTLVDLLRAGRPKRSESSSRGTQRHCRPASSASTLLVNSSMQRASVTMSSAAWFSPSITVVLISPQ